MNALKRQRIKVGEIVLKFLKIIFALNAKNGKTTYKTEFLHRSPRTGALSFKIGSTTIERYVVKYNDEYLFVS
jgi:hypothetical protein